MKNFFLILFLIVCMLRNVGTFAQAGGSNECFDGNYHSYMINATSTELSVFYLVDNNFTKRVYDLKTVDKPTFREIFTTSWDSHHNPYILETGNEIIANKSLVMIDPISCIFISYIFPNNSKF